MSLMLLILFSSGALGTHEDYDSYNYHNNHHTSDDYQSSYDYPDIIEQDYEEDSYGVPEEDYSNEQQPTAIREYESDDNNCMGVESFQMTADMSNCCEILKSKSTDVSIDKIEKCISLRLHHYYGIPLNYDTEKQVLDRRTSRKSCTVFGDPMLLEYVCCGRKSCETWSRRMVKNVCRACYAVCPICKNQRKLH